MTRVGSEAPSRSEEPLWAGSEHGQWSVRPPYLARKSRSEAVSSLKLGHPSIAFPAPGRDAASAS